MGGDEERGRDAIGRFVAKGGMCEKVVDEITEVAGTEVSDVADTLEVVGKQLAYSEGEKADILAAFVKGGQMTAGGFLQAVSYVAQTVEDPSRSHDLGESGIRAMELASAVR